MVVNISNRQVLDSLELIAGPQRPVEVPVADLDFVYLHVKNIIPV